LAERRTGRQSKEQDCPWNGMAPYLHEYILTVGDGSQKSIERADVMSLWINVIGLRLTATTP
jgi:hypothetical protein